MGYARLQIPDQYFLVSCSTCFYEPIVLFLLDCYTRDLSYCCDFGGAVIIKHSSYWWETPKERHLTPIESEHQRTILSLLQSAFLVHFNSLSFCGIVWFIIGIDLLFNLWKTCLEGNIEKARTISNLDRNFQRPIGNNDSNPLSCVLACSHTE